MKDLVQELRELAAKNDDCNAIRGVLGGGCTRTYCNRCASDALIVIANRIECEYDPKPEPDTVEKVAVDMLLFIWRNFDSETMTSDELLSFKKRLEALGVKVDG